MLFLWPVCSQFDPDDVPVFRFLASPAVVAEPAPIRHSDVQAVRVKSCWTWFTAQKLPSCNITEIKLSWKAFPGLTHKCGTIYTNYSWVICSRVIKTSTHIPPSTDTHTVMCFGCEWLQREQCRYWNVFHQNFILEDKSSQSGSILRLKLFLMHQSLEWIAFWVSVSSYTTSKKLFPSDITANSAQTGCDWNCWSSAFLLIFSSSSVFD